MRFATAAHDFGTAHAQGIMGLVNNAAFADGLVERRPAAAAFKLGITYKKGITTNSTIVGAFVFQGFKRRAPGPLRAFLPGHLEQAKPCRQR